MTSIDSLIRTFKSIGKKAKPLSYLLSTGLFFTPINDVLAGDTEDKEKTPVEYILKGEAAAEFTLTEDHYLEGPKKDLLVNSMFAAQKKCVKATPEVNDDNKLTDYRELAKENNIQTAVKVTKRGVIFEGRPNVNIGSGEVLIDPYVIRNFCNGSDAGTEPEKQTWNASHGREFDIYLAEKVTPKTRVVKVETKYALEKDDKVIPLNQEEEEKFIDQVIDQEENRLAQLRNHPAFKTVLKNVRSLSPEQRSIAPTDCYGEEVLGDCVSIIIDQDGNGKYEKSLVLNKNNQFNTKNLGRIIPLDEIEKKTTTIFDKTRYSFGLAYQLGAFGENELAKLGDIGFEANFFLRRIESGLYVPVKVAFMLPGANSQMTLPEERVATSNPNRFDIYQSSLDPRILGVNIALGFGDGRLFTRAVDAIGGEGTMPFYMGLEATAGIRYANVSLNETQTSHIELSGDVVQGSEIGPVDLNKPNQHLFGVTLNPALTFFKGGDPSAYFTVGAIVDIPVITPENISKKVTVNPTIAIGYEY